MYNESFDLQNLKSIKRVKRDPEWVLYEESRCQALFRRILTVIYTKRKPLVSTIITWHLQRVLVDSYMDFKNFDVIQNSENNSVHILDHLIQLERIICRMVILDWFETDLIFVFFIEITHYGRFEFGQWLVHFNRINQPIFDYQIQAQWSNEMLGFKKIIRPDIWNISLES